MSAFIFASKKNCNCFETTFKVRNGIQHANTKQLHNWSSWWESASVNIIHSSTKNAIPPPPSEPSVAKEVNLCLFLQFGFFDYL